MTPENEKKLREDFAALDPTSPDYGEKEQEFFRALQANHVKTTEHDAKAKALQAAADDNAGMYPHAKKEPKKDK